VRKAFAAYAGGKRLNIKSVSPDRCDLILEGRQLGQAEILTYAQSRDLSEAGVFDRVGSWALAPFEIDLREIPLSAAEEAAEYQ
ncbi:MAG: hypothetical protein IJF67_06930, partial [Clostridia bacterium]|nr:hypothetical protein [Clostridia bacterium]